MNLERLNGYDAIIVVSFGGPEGEEEVMPFLENILKGRSIPQQRMIQVAQHYFHFGGISPINGQNRQLIQALKQQMQNQGLGDLNIYWGNRNWAPYLEDTIQQMTKDGVSKALAYVTSAYSSYSSCRQYLENIEQARLNVGPRAPRIEKLRPFYNHPGFIKANVANLVEALNQLPLDLQSCAHVVFTAHSIPTEMASASSYEKQLRQTAELCIIQANLKNNFSLAYSSRSGPPSQSWLEPDIVDHLEDLHNQGVRAVIMSPIGFVSDHMEVRYDLDVEAMQKADKLSIVATRAKTVGSNPLFIGTILDLIKEKTNDKEPKFLGPTTTISDFCSEQCCLKKPTVIGQ